MAGRTVVEIGPGPGGLTAALLEAGAQVLAFELDEGWAGFLEDELAGPELTLIVGDVRAEDGRWLAAQLAERGTGSADPLLLASNLPYHIASPVLVDLVRLPTALERLVVTIQAEVADRLLAPAGSAQRGLLTLLVALAARVRRCFRLPPGAFRPRAPGRLGGGVPRAGCRPAPAPGGPPRTRNGSCGRPSRGAGRCSAAPSRGSSPAEVLERLDPELGRRRPQDLTTEQWRELARQIAGPARPR